MKKLKALFIVAGHSDKSPWAYYDWLSERDLNIEIAENLTDRLLENDLDFKIIPVWIYTNLSLQEKINTINDICKRNWYNLDNSLLLSIHINAGGWTGVEWFSYNDYIEGKDYCKVLVDSVVKETGLRNRGAKFERLSRYDSLWIIHNTTPLACLIENGFIDGTEDRKVLKENIVAFSDWLYNGLKEYIWFEEIIEEEEEDNLDDIIDENTKLKIKLWLYIKAVLKLKKDIEDKDLIIDWIKDLLK